MANPAEPGTTARTELTQRPANESPVHPSFHGRPVSWVAVSIIMAGFLVGGAGLVIGQRGPTWWLFWAGTGLTVLGLLLTVATNTFDDWY
jgi:hypothetical protein